MDSLRLRALELAEGMPISPKSIAKVAAATGPEEARWAFTQWELRRIGRPKFERASEMFFTREALEQATRAEVARYHASRFPTGELVADLTCGIGADLLALAERGPATGYDLDPERAEYAAHNMAIHGFKTQITCADSLASDWPDYVFGDPARRVEGVRKLDPSQFAPDPFVLSSRMANLELGGIKLTPLLKDSYLETLGPELAFVAAGDECPEVVVWCGKRAESGRYAVFASDGEILTSKEDMPVVREPSEWFYEAHPAAIRGHCLGTLCDRYGLSGVADSNGYLTGSECRSPWMKRYRVLSDVCGDVKILQRELRAFRSSSPIIKSRANIDVEKLRRSLRSEGHRLLIVAVYPAGKSLRYVILEDGNGL